MELKEKIKGLKAFDILRIVMGLNFLTAAIFRTFNFGFAKTEVNSLLLPWFFALVVIGVEYICGIMFLMNKKPKAVAGVLIGFLILATILGTIAYGPIQLLKDSGELFVYNLDPTDIYMHITYLVVLVYMFFELKNK